MTSPSPFDKQRSVRWCLAGATADGVSVYCISIAESPHDVILWAYSTLKDRWYQLTTVSSDALPRGHYCCTPSACLSDPHVRIAGGHSYSADHWSLNLRVVTYLENSESVAFIVVFNVDRRFAGHLEDVYRSTDSHKALNFRSFNRHGPQLIDYQNCLFLGGSVSSDFGAIFRVFKVRLIYTPDTRTSHEMKTTAKTFALTEVYQFDPIFTRLVVWRDHLTLVDLMKLRVLNLSRAAGSLDNDPTFERAVANEIHVTPGYFNVFTCHTYGCCSTNSGRDLWLMHASGCAILKSACNDDDDNLSDFYWLKVTCPSTPANSEGGPVGDDSSNPVQIFDCRKNCVGSDSSLFWVDNSLKLRSRMVGLVSLQHWCFTTLFKSYPILKRENVDPRKLGIPLMLWNRFVPDFVDDQSDATSSLDITQKQKK